MWRLLTLNCGVRPLAAASSAVNLPSHPKYSCASSSWHPVGARMLGGAQFLLLAWIEVPVASIVASENGTRLLVIVSLSSLCGFSAAHALGTARLASFTSDHLLGVSALHSSAGSCRLFLSAGTARLMGPCCHDIMRIKCRFCHCYPAGGAKSAAVAAPCRTTFVFKQLRTVLALCQPSCRGIRASPAFPSLVRDCRQEAEA